MPNVTRHLSNWASSDSCPWCVWYSVPFLLPVTCHRVLLGTFTWGLASHHQPLCLPSILTQAGPLAAALPPTPPVLQALSPSSPDTGQGDRMLGLAGALDFGYFSEARWSCCPSVASMSPSVIPNAPGPDLGVTLQCLHHLLSSKD